MMYYPPVVRFLNDSEMELVKPFTYEWEEKGEEFRIDLPVGFTFDGASVPRICWSLTGLLPTGVHLGAAAVHDYCYQRRGRLLDGEVAQKIGGRWEPIPVWWTRKECDDLFNRIMKDAKETTWKRRVMYISVRLLGWKAWDN